MDPANLRHLLRPFFEGSAGLPVRELTDAQLANISTYIDILLRWNARVNLTAVRKPEEIVTRHFGESLFGTRYLFPGLAGGAPGVSSVEPVPAAGQAALDLIDVGSGAGFPGLAIKLFVPSLRVTLIDSQQKKATFLREVIRALTLTDIDVFAGRAQDFVGVARVVTLRAVERFEETLPSAAALVSAGGALGLFLGRDQMEAAQRRLPGFAWREPISLPLSSNRILLISR
jgi:16S rRNA (guanine527-N7)-methyltransferase